MAFRCILVEYTRNMIAEDELLRCTGFDWDDANVLKIWQKHQVSAMECEEVFFNLPLVAGHDEKHSHDERRYYVLGQSDGGRRLFVVVTIREGLLRVISARDMNARNERFTNQYERQKEKEGSEAQRRGSRAGILGVRGFNRLCGLEQGSSCDVSGSEAIVEDDLSAASGNDDC